MIYLLARRFALSKTVDNVELGWSEKQCVAALVKMYNWPLWPIQAIRQRFFWLLL